MNSTLTVENDGRDYYTVAEAAKLLDVSIATVWRWVTGGKLPAYRVGPRKIRIAKKDLSAVISPAQRRKQAATTDWRALSPPVSAEELKRRQALAAEILALREQCDIIPLTTAQHLRRVRKTEMHST
ncbi:MAG: DNA-binding protein [Dehalococcoidia bacterium]|nr:DNA-binding protein [Dehalococcoidia bacterium]